MDYAYTCRPCEFFSPKAKLLDPQAEQSPEMRPIYLPIQGKPDINHHQENGKDEEPKIVEQNGFLPSEDYSVAVSSLISKFETNSSPSPKKPSLIKSKSFSAKGTRRIPRTNQTQDDGLHYKTEAEVEEIRKLGVRDLRKKFESKPSPVRAEIIVAEELSPLENLASKRLDHFRRLSKKWEREIGELLQYLIETSDIDIYNVRLQDLELAINRDLHGMKVKTEEVAPQETATPEKKLPELEPLSHVAKITSMYEIKSKELNEEKPRTPTQTPKRLPWTSGRRTPRIKDREIEEAASVQEQEEQTKEEIAITEEETQEVAAKESEIASAEADKPSDFIDTEHLKSASLITSYFNSLSKANNRNNENSLLKEKAKSPEPYDLDYHGVPEEEITINQNLNYQASSAGEDECYKSENDKILEQNENQDFYHHETPEVNKASQEESYENKNEIAQETDSDYNEIPETILTEEDDSYTHEQDEHHGPEDENEKTFNEPDNPHETTIDREFEKYYTEDLRPTGSEERLFEDYYRENVLEDSIPEEPEEEIGIQYEEEAEEEKLSVVAGTKEVEVPENPEAEIRIEDEEEAEEEKASVVEENKEVPKDSVPEEPEEEIRIKYEEEAEAEKSSVVEEISVAQNKLEEEVEDVQLSCINDDSSLDEAKVQEEDLGFLREAKIEEKTRNQEPLQDSSRVTKDIVFVELATETNKAEQQSNVVEKPDESKTVENAEKNKSEIDKQQEEQIQATKNIADLVENNQETRKIVEEPIREVVEESPQVSEIEEQSSSLLVEPGKNEENAVVEEIAPVMRFRNEEESSRQKGEAAAASGVEGSCLRKYIMDTNEFLSHEQIGSA